MIGDPLVELDQDMLLECLDAIRLSMRFDVLWAGLHRPDGRPLPCDRRDRHQWCRQSAAQRVRTGGGDRL